MIIREGRGREGRGGEGRDAYNRTDTRVNELLSEVMNQSSILLIIHNTFIVLSSNKKTLLIKRTLQN